jgi:hypothetical protein
MYRRQIADADVGAATGAVDIIVAAVRNLIPGARVPRAADEARILTVTGRFNNAGSRARELSAVFASNAYERLCSAVKQARASDAVWLVR